MQSSTEQMTNDRLALVYQLSQTFNSSLDLDEVLEIVMDEIIQAIKAERGFVMLRDASSQLEFRTARGFNQETIEDPVFQVSKGIVEEVAHTQQALHTFDALHDPRFSLRESVQGLRLRSILCVPLITKSRLVGVVYLDNRLQAGIFTKEDLDLLLMIGASASVAIENARLYKIAIEKGKLERELQMARQVQASLLPSEVPLLPGWEFSAQWLPARDVAGDFYDFITFPDGTVHAIIADVTDKGIPAALFMVFAQSVLRGNTAEGRTLQETIKRANEAISKESAYGMYVSLVQVAVSPASSQVHFVSAGHTPIFYYSRLQEKIEQFNATGMMLGIDESVGFREKVIDMSPGDFLFLYTDGVVDAQNSAEQFFGSERMEKLVWENRYCDSRELMLAVERDLLSFIGSTPMFDDVTIMVIRRQNTANR